MKKRSSTPRAKAIKQADYECRELVMMKEPFCVTCGKPGRGDPSHYFTRRRFGTRWDTDNLHNQCQACHLAIYHNQNPKEYTDWMYRKLGKEGFDALERKSNQVTKLTTADILAIAESLRQRRLELGRE
jgi:hypothetical protein